MKIKFSVPELQKRLGQLCAVVARKSQEALYGNVRIFTKEDGMVCLQGIDIDTTLTVKLPGAKAEGAVNILLEFAVLNAIVQTLRATEVLISYTTEAEAVISTGKYKGRLKASPVEKFVELPLVTGIAEKPELGGYVFGLPGLKEQIEQVDFAVPAPDGKFVVASALLTSTDTTLTVVATDGVFLATSSVPNANGAFKFTVPKPALEVLKKIDGGPSVTISDTDGSFFFETELELLTYNKTHAEFPPYEKILPTPGTYPTQVVINNKEELLNTLQRIRVSCPDKDKPGANFKVDAEGLLVTAIKEEKQATGDLYYEMGNDFLSCNLTGQPGQTKVDLKRLLSFVERATFPITMFIKATSSVIDFHSMGSTQEKPGYRFLIMPMRRDDDKVASSVVQIPVTE